MAVRRFILNIAMNRHVIEIEGVLPCLMASPDWHIRREAASALAFKSSNPDVDNVYENHVR